MRKYIFITNREHRRPPLFQLLYREANSNQAETVLIQPFSDSPLEEPQAQTTPTLSLSYAPLTCTE